MWACVQVFVYICVFVSVHARISEGYRCTCVDDSVDVCVCVCVSLCVCACVRACVCARARVSVNAAGLGLRLSIHFPLLLSICHRAK